MELSKNKEDIKRLRDKDIFTIFYNGHRKEFIKALIEVDKFSQLDPEQCAGFKNIPGAQGQMPTRTRIKAKEMVAEFNNRALEHFNSLESIKRVEKNLKNLEKLIDEKKWHTKKSYSEIAPEKN